MARRNAGNSSLHLAGIWIFSMGILPRVSWASNLLRMVDILTNVDAFDLQIYVQFPDFTSFLKNFEVIIIQYSLSK
jgi:hypothetical protein